MEYFEAVCTDNNCGLEGNHSPGQACDDGEYRATRTCTQGGWIVTGCSGGNGTGGTGTSGTGGSNGNTNSINNNTVVVVPVDRVDIANRNKLIALTNNPLIKSKINYLAPKIFSDTLSSQNLREDGFRFKKIDDNTYLERPPSFWDKFRVRYFPAYQEKEIVSIHIHQQYFFNTQFSPWAFKNSPVYSNGDIIEFLDNIEFVKNTTPELTEDVTSILLTKIGGFALVVKNKTKAIAAQQALLNPDVYDNFNNDFIEKVLKGTGDDGDCNNISLVKRITKFIKTHEINGEKMGISIYRAIIDNNNEIAFWNKL